MLGHCHRCERLNGQLDYRTGWCEACTRAHVCPRWLAAWSVWVGIGAAAEERRLAVSHIDTMTPTDYGTTEDEGYDLGYGCATCDVEDALEDGAHTRGWRPREGS